MATILIVDRDERMRALVSDALAGVGHRVVIATDAESALAVLASDQVELVMVDALVERADGLSVLRELTHRRSAPPIMALPPVGEEDTVVPAPRQGGRAAAGPVPMPELLTRVDRQLARIGPAVQDPHVLRIGGLEVDVLRRTVTTPDETIRLSAREAAVLDYLGRRPGQVCPREALLHDLWGDDVDLESRVLEVCVGRLQTKLVPYSPIRTVRGVGYSLW